MTHHLKILPIFRSGLKSHNTINLLEINISPLRQILAGIGETFNNLAVLTFFGGSIEFVERRNFENMTQLVLLGLVGHKIKFLDEDLLANLPNLATLYFGRNRIEKLPRNIFQNQKHLKTVNFANNKLTHLYGALFAFNHMLEDITMNGNNFTRIGVDFTRLRALYHVNAKNCRCIDAEWFKWDGSLQSFQNKIIRRCL